MSAFKKLQGKIESTGKILSKVMTEASQQNKPAQAIARRLKGK